MTLELELREFPRVLGNMICDYLIETESSLRQLVEGVSPPWIEDREFLVRDYAKNKRVDRWCWFSSDFYDERQRQVRVTFGIYLVEDQNSVELLERTHIENDAQSIETDEESDIDAEDEFQQDVNDNVNDNDQVDSDYEETWETSRQDFDSLKSLLLSCHWRLRFLCLDLNLHDGIFFRR